MNSSLMKMIEREIKKSAQSVVNEAAERAAYRVQKDFHTKAIDTIAKKTNHPTLSQACYCMLTGKDGGIEVDIYYDASVIDGFFESNSRYHKSGSPWSVVSEHQGLSNYDFWENYEEADVSQHGEVDHNWIMKNFWNGYEWRTNGWPLPGGGEFLQTWKVRTVSAYDVAQKYIDDYIAEGHYGKYINEEIRNLSK
jgi:hypothetical protein